MRRMFWWISKCDVTHIILQKTSTIFQYSCWGSCYRGAANLQPFSDSNDFKYFVDDSAKCELYIVIKLICGWCKIPPKLSIQRCRSLSRRWISHLCFTDAPKSRANSCSAAPLLLPYSGRKHTARLTDLIENIEAITGALASKQIQGIIIIYVGSSNHGDTDKPHGWSAGDNQSDFLTNTETCPPSF